jgi:hypothetical protein
MTSTNRLADVKAAAERLLGDIEAQPPHVRAWLRPLETELCDIAFRVESAHRRQIRALDRALCSETTAAGAP